MSAMMIMVNLMCTRGNCYTIPKNFINKYMNYPLCLLLILLSGDIELNPGPSQNNLNICHLNIRSIKAHNRLEQLEELITNTHTFPIVALTETHLDGTVTDSEINIPNYTIHRKDRNRNGGGVAIYIHNNLTATRRLDLEVPNLEIVWVEIKVDKHKILVGSCYRPPGQRVALVDEFLELLSSSLDKVQDNRLAAISLLGDFNDRCENWDTNHSHSELGNKLKILLTQHNLFQLIDEPTRDNHVLDLLITDSPNFFLHTGVLPSLSNLDHDIIFGEFKITCCNTSSYTRHVRYYDRANLATSYYLMTFSPELIGIPRLIILHWRRTSLSLLHV